MATIYLIGSLRNPKIPNIAEQIRDAGHDVFDDWFSAGPEADDWWRKYEMGRGRTYHEALKGYAAVNTFRHDKRHLDRCDAAVMVLPAGRSAHLELGYVVGSGRRGYVLLDKKQPRWDVMLGLADGVFESLGDLILGMKEGLQ
jgi:hypothetical protein